MADIWPDSSNSSKERSQETAPTRKAMHDAIDKGDFDEVEKYLNENRDFKQWLHPDTGRSALCNAREKKELKIYALLMFRNCKLNKAKEKEELFEELNDMEEREYHYNFHQFCYKCDIPVRLLSISNVSANNDMFGKVKELYEKLYKIPMIDTILEVVATDPKLEVIFDFGSETLDRLLGNKHKSKQGLTKYRERRIYLGANRGDNDLLGTMAHEFCHHALHMVYNNNGLPYKQDDPVLSPSYLGILDNIKRSKITLHDKIAEALDNPKELIVRVPHMLALMHYGKHDTHEAHMPTGEGKVLLQKQVPELLEFFEKYVLEDMKKFITQNSPDKDNDEIREQNRELGKAKKTESLGIQFKTPYDLEDYPCLVLTAQGLTLLEVKINDAVRLKGRSYVFLDLMQWDDKLQLALKENKCHYVVISSNSKDYPEEKILIAMKDVLRDLTEFRATKVIVLTQNSEQDKFVKAIKDLFGDKARDLAVPDCGLADVTDQCKAYVFESCSIQFQEVCELSVAKVMKSCTDGRHIDLDEEMGYDTFINLRRGIRVDVGPKLKTLDKRIDSYYLERTCERVTQVDLSVALRTLTNEAFAIAGSCSEAIDALRLPGCHACHHSKVQRFEGCVLLDSMDDYDALAQSSFYSGKTVHLLRYDSGLSQYYWVRSNGPLGPLVKVVSGECEICDTKALIHVIPDKVVAICGASGMGKSVMSLRMAKDIKALDQMTYVLQVDLRNPEIDSVDCSTVGGMTLAKLCGLDEDSFGFKLLNRSISLSSPVKVAVIFDALDEVDDQRRKDLAKLVAALRKTRIWKIFLFGRNCSKSEMQEKFHTIPFEMLGLKDDEQVQFLKMCWKRDHRQIDDEDPDALAQSYLRRFSSQEESPITSNPMLIEVIAVVPKNSTRNRCKQKAR
ncbi:uncharacterized protein LOC135366590 isoform X2 [Ornithodoros turicata]|uniref:uncharacterized protein LOC135366590 isoform X2 n=1 Tax=Ornithodoros turicata TaxID=34597 RepID=UPI0031390D95